MPAKSLTLEQRIQRGIELHQFRFDDYREVPDPHLWCNWCDEGILLDYIGLGYREMSSRLMHWLSEHSRCEPKLQTKTGTMMLTPREKKAV